MKQREWITLIIVVSVIAALSYLSRGRGYGLQKQPDRISGNTASFDDIFPESLGQHFVHPNEIQDPVNLPLRYPPRAGHEITTLIQHGYAALFQPRGNLKTWLECPPSEEG